MASETITYDSGFVGYITPQTVIEKKELNINQVISNVKLNKKTSPIQKSSVYNPEVMNIVKRYETNTKQSGDIHFVCDLVECALRAIDSKLINSWLALQVKNPDMSDMHVRFIEDTFQFINTGTRSINIMSWSRMLDGTHNETSVTTKKLDLVKLLGGSSFNQITPGSVKTVDILFQWLSNPNGVEDLVYALPVLFGKV